MLTESQYQILSTQIRADADAGVIAALAQRNDTGLVVLLNTASAVDAWVPSMVKRDLFEATDITKFDSLTAGKRDAWKLLLDNTPIDMTRQKNRKAVEDTWGNVDSVTVLQACTRKATRGENYFGSASATTNTVTAVKLNLPGNLTLNDVSYALNKYAA